MDDEAQKYARMADAASQIESAIDNFIRAARDLGDDNQEIADTVADRLCDASDRDIIIEDTTIKERG